MLVSARVKQRLLAILTGSYRLIQVFCVSYFVVFFGMQLPLILKENGVLWGFKDIRMIYGGPVLGGAFILATIKFLAEKFPALWDYISKNKSDAITRFYSALFVAVMGFSLASLSVREIVEKKSRPSVFLNFDTSSARVEMGNESGLPVIFFTFPEGKAELNAGDAQLSLLREISETLVECSKLGNENRQQIEIKLVGFASSSGNDIQNLELADRRAKKIKSYLHAEFGKLQFPVEKRTILMQSWETSGEMKKRRVFMDQKRVAGSFETYSQKAGALNRRVELHLLDVAGCLVG